MLPRIDSAGSDRSSCDVDDTEHNQRLVPPQQHDHASGCGGAGDRSGGRGGGGSDGNGYRPLFQTFGELVPLIGASVKETKSHGPKRLLYNLSINSKLLYYEVTAIKIQSCVRRFLGRLRTSRIRRHLAFFYCITEGFADRILEEVVLAMSLEVSLAFVRNNLRYKRLMLSVETEILLEIEELVEAHVLKTCKAVVQETISEAIDAVVKLRLESKRLMEPKRPVAAPNAMITLADDLCSEAASMLLRSIAIQAVQEEVQQYLLDTYCAYVLSHVLEEGLGELSRLTLADVLRIHFGQLGDGLVGPLLLELAATGMAGLESANSGTGSTGGTGTPAGSPCNPSPAADDNAAASDDAEAIAAVGCSDQEVDDNAHGCGGDRAGMASRQDINDSGPGDSSVELPDAPADQTEELESLHGGLNPTVRTAAAATALTATDPSAPSAPSAVFSSPGTTANRVLGLTTTVTLTSLHSSDSESSAPTAASTAAPTAPPAPTALTAAPTALPTSIAPVVASIQELPSPPKALF